MKKKIIALGSVLILVFGIFIFKNFYMNDKNVKNENSKDCLLISMRISPLAFTHLVKKHKIYQ